jgi:Rod binding domain-containing protein
MTSPLSSLSPRSVDATKLESFDELAKAHPEAATAARQFEAVFLRQLLSCVEKSSGLGEGSETQGAVVGSMVVGALSDEMSAAGGIGLSDIILRAMLQNESAPTPVVPHTEPDEGSPGGPLTGSQP